MRLSYLDESFEAASFLSFRALHGGSRWREIIVVYHILSKCSDILVYTCGCFTVLVDLPAYIRRTARRKYVHIAFGSEPSHQSA